MLELVRAGGAGEHRIERIKDTPVLRLRNRLLPLLYLKEVFRLGDSDRESGFVVVIQVGNQVFGAVVDGVLHTEEIVIKPMSSKLRHIAVFSGTTILGDGSVIMILDPNGVGAGARPRRAGRAGRVRPNSSKARRPRSTIPSRCWCSAPARSGRKRCRCRWSRALRKSIAAASKSPTAGISCNIAIS